MIRTDELAAAQPFERFVVYEPNTIGYEQDQIQNPYLNFEIQKSQ